MHHHLEIIMPPTEDVKKSIDQIMAPYSENYEDEEGETRSHAFWDFYVIGGRYSGVRINQQFEGPRLDQFHKLLNEKKITVSSLTCGKEKLQPASQIPEVDKLWREHFPEGGEVCPLFNHYNDQYTDSQGFPDIIKLKDLHKNLHAAKVIIAKEHWKDKGKLDIGFMIEDSSWNGVNYIDSSWKGGVFEAVNMWKEKLETYKEEYKEKNMPKDNWLAVTVDYHS